MSLLLIVLGMVLLYFGADFLVRGSSTIALRLKIKPLIIGLTVVAFGTSAPELVVSIKAGIVDSADLAVGNVVGSNIFNTLFILGIAALLRPIKTHINLIKWDIPVAIFASILLVVLLLDRNISTIEGIVLFCGIIIYVLVNIIKGREESSPTIDKEIKQVIPTTKLNFLLQIFLVIIGIVGLVFGANYFVKGAIRLALLFNINQAVIGITIVAAGTSLPELATSALASIKKEGDISIGNVLGSNIFNIFCILGIAAIIQPITIQNITMFDLGTMLFSAVLVFPFMKTGFTLSRLEGATLVMLYFVYLTILIIKIS